VVVMERVEEQVEEVEVMAIHTAVEDMVILTAVEEEEVCLTHRVVEEG